jgi:hypothetical protein
MQRTMPRAALYLATALAASSLVAQTKIATGPMPSASWNLVTHGACCEGNVAASGSATYVLLPELLTGNDIKRSTNGGLTWTKVYPPADVSVPFGIEGDLRAYDDDVVFFGTELSHGVAAHSDNQGTSWTIVQIPVAFPANDQAWLYLGPVQACPIQTEPYVLAGWYRIGSVALFSCDGGLTWPIQTPLVGFNGSGPIHVVCLETAHGPAPQGDIRIPDSRFARMKAGRHGGWGTDGKFYWSQIDGNQLYVCKSSNFGATWEGIRHPVASGTPIGHPVTTLAFDDRGTLFVLHANKLYVSFDQGESIKFVHTLPRWGNDASVADRAAAWFVVHGGTIHLGLKSAGNIWYLKGSSVDTATPTWSEELITNAGSTVRLDFMQIVIDGNGIPTLGYTTSAGGVTTSSRNAPP